MRHLHKLMLGVLETAQKGRAACKDLSWIETERMTMFNAVNSERIKRGLDPIDLKAIMRAENFACGHTDYSTKFALYCAEIIEHGRFIE